MKTFNYTIQDEIGIHAKPAGLLAKKAKSCKMLSTKFYRIYANMQQHFRTIC